MYTFYNPCTIRIAIASVTANVKDQSLQRPGEGTAYRHVSTRQAGRYDLTIYAGL